MRLNNLSKIFFIVVLFNRSWLKQNINRAIDKFELSDFIHQEAAQIISQIADDCKENFENILEIGAKTGSLGKKIADSKNSKNLIQIDPSEKMVQKYHLNFAMDDEKLDFPDSSFDLVVSNLNWHFVNDLPNHLKTIKNTLKPNGMLVASFFGEENLKELREVFFKTEEELFGKITPRIAPNIDIKSAGMLAQKAGFDDVVAEKHKIEVHYSDIKNLFLDLRNMSASNILNEKSRKFMSKKFLFNLTENYKKLYYAPRDNSIIATFEFIVLTAWKKR